MDNIDNNPNFQRAMIEMDKFNDPRYLITYWTAVGPWRSSDLPSVENLRPWWSGIESLIGIKGKKI